MKTVEVRMSSLHGVETVPDLSPKHEIPSNFIVGPEVEEIGFNGMDVGFQTRGEEVFVRPGSNEIFDINGGALPPAEEYAMIQDPMSALILANRDARMQARFRVMPNEGVLAGVPVQPVSPQMGESVSLPIPEV